MIKKTITFLSILFFFITCGTFGLYTYLRYSIMPKYEQKLLSIADKREHEIGKYLNQQEQNALLLSQETTIINLFNNTVSNQEPVTNTQKAITTIAAHKETMGFKNILLTNTNGVILFSTTKKDLVGTNINQPMYTNSSLGKSYERASMALTNDFSNFNFNTLLEEPALFITIPILKDKKNNI